MKDLTVKKTPLWGKIAVTLFALLTFGAVAGYVVSLICAWFVMPGIAAGWYLFVEGFNLEYVLENLLALNTAGFSEVARWAFATGDMSVVVLLIEAACASFWNVLGAYSYLLIVAPCLLLPIHAWLLSKKRWGGIVVVAAFLLSGLGFLLLLICSCEASLRNAAATVIREIYYAYINAGFSGWISVLRVIVGAVLSNGRALCATLGMLLMAVLAFFGMRPKVVAVLDQIAIGGALSIGVGWFAFNQINMLITYSNALEMLLYELEWFFRYYMLTFTSNLGATLVSLSSFAICFGVILTSLVFVISTKMPALIGKKKS